MQQQYLDVLEYLPERIVTDGGLEYPLRVDMDGELLMLSYSTSLSNQTGVCGTQEFSLTMPEFLLKNERTFEVLGLLQAEMGKTQTGTLSFSNCEPKLIHHVMRWFAEEKLLAFDQWRWSIKLNMQEPFDPVYRQQIEQKVIDYWLSKTNIASDKRYPKTVTYIKNTSHTTLKEHYYGTLVLEYRNNLFSQIIKNFVKKITYETVLTCELPLIRGFMRGIIAGEGSIEHNSNRGHYRVHISASLEEEREIYRKCLFELGIDLKVYKDYKETIISERLNLIELLRQRLMTLNPTRYNKFLYMIQQFSFITEETGYFNRKEKVPWNKYPVEIIDSIVKLYNSEIHDPKEIAQRLNIHKLKVQRVLREHNLGRRRTSTTEDLRKQIVGFAKTNPKMPFIKIAEHFHVHESVVRRACKKYQLKRTSVERRTIPEEKIQHIIQLYKENPIIKFSEIRKIIDVSDTVIKRVRKEHGLEKLGFMHLIGNNNRKYKLQENKNVSIGER